MEQESVQGKKNQPPRLPARPGPAPQLPLPELSPPNVPLRAPRLRNRALPVRGLVTPWTKELELPRGVALVAVGGASLGGARIWPRPSLIAEHQREQNSWTGQVEVGGKTTLLRM